MNLFYPSEIQRQHAPDHSNSCAVSMWMAWERCVATSSALDSPTQIVHLQKILKQVCIIHVAIVILSRRWERSRLWRRQSRPRDRYTSRCSYNLGRCRLRNSSRCPRASPPWRCRPRELTAWQHGQVVTARRPIKRASRVGSVGSQRRRIRVLRIRIRIEIEAWGSADVIDEGPGSHAGAGCAQTHNEFKDDAMVFYYLLIMYFLTRHKLLVSMTSEVTPSSVRILGLRKYQEIVIVQFLEHTPVSFTWLLLVVCWQINQY